MVQSASSWSSTDLGGARAPAHEVEHDRNRSRVFGRWCFRNVVLLGFLLSGAGACRSRADARETPSVPTEHTSVSAAALTSSATVAAPPKTGTLREVTWQFPSGPFGPSEVVVAIPEGAKKPLPVLVAFHGRGEALKGPHRGARGWIDDYALQRATSRLSTPPLRPNDFEGFVTSERLTVLNRELSKRAYDGVIVVCPYLPDILRGPQVFSQAPKLADFIVDQVLPRVYRETPAIASSESTGIDGVSLGGRAALFIGLLKPRAFGAMGALQPAIDDGELDQLVTMAQKARAENPKLVLRLLTSSDDYFLDVTRALSTALNAAGVVHQFDLVVGPHDYSFNRGPGVYELLTHYDRVLRGAPSIPSP